MSHSKYIVEKVATLVCAAFLLFPISGLAEKIDCFPPCYQGNELAKVREWESKWVGKRISSANVDEVKEFLPESIYDMMKNTERWGESWFTIVPYRQVPITQGCATFTKQYYGQSKVGSNGDLLNWVSGFPFPDTKVGIEMAHNFRCLSFGDAFRSTEKGYIIDGRLKYDMEMEIQSNRCFFSGRWDTPPVPEFPNNPKEIWQAYHMLQIAPPESRNFRLMEVMYKDRMKSYDSWMWLSVIRRVRRRSTSERQDALGGGDFCSYDNNGWDGPIQINKYKYLGPRELLLLRHTDTSKLEHTPGDCLLDGFQRERIKTHVVEVVNKDPNFMYSRMFWYIDPESWQVLCTDRYDRRGKLWKVLEQFGSVVKGYGGAEFGHFAGAQMVDVQRLHSTSANTDMKYGVEIPQWEFTINYLQKYGY